MGEIIFKDARYKRAFLNIWPGLDGYAKEYYDNVVEPLKPRFIRDKWFSCVNDIIEELPKAPKWAQEIIDKNEYHEWLRNKFHSIFYNKYKK